MEAFLIALLFSLVTSIAFGFLFYEITESSKKVWLSILIVFVFWFSLVFYGYFITGKKWKLIERNKIYSLDLLNSVSGTFFLGCGSISHSYTYYFYVETNEGYKIKTLSVGRKVDDIYLRFTNKQPRYECYVRNKILLEDCICYIYVPKNYKVKIFNLTQENK